MNASTKKNRVKIDIAGLILKNRNEIQLLLASEWFLPSLNAFLFDGKMC